MGQGKGPPSRALCIKGGAVFTESWNRLFLPAYTINNFKSPEKEQTIY